MCRRVVPAARPCDLDAATVRQIHTADDKQALIDAIWGAPSVRDELSRAARAPANGLARRLTAAIGFGSVGALAVELLGHAGLVSSLAAGLIGGTFGFASAPRGRVLVPSGGAPITRPPRFALGRILPCERILSPASDSDCAAWALELRHDGSWGSRTTLRVGASAGFHLELDDGERVRIPPGPLWIHGTLPQHTELEGRGLEELLHVLDPLRVRDQEPWPLFRFNILSERTLQIGDRIELLGAVDRALLPPSRDVSYREAPATVMVPRGLPELGTIST